MRVTARRAWPTCWNTWSSRGRRPIATIPKALQERGARFNGSTWVDRTNYYETLPATEDNLKFALDLEADRLVNSFVKQEDLLSEMTVVRNEFERGENSPSNLLNQRMMAAAFDWHNYGKSTIGNRTDIERVPILKLQDFYRKYYQPDNCMLVIAGKFDPAKAMALVEKHFGKLPKPTRKLDKTYTEEPPQDGERSVTVAARGRRGTGRRGLSHSLRRTSRHRGAGRAGQHFERAAFGPAVQGPGRVEDRHRRFGERLELARSGRVRSRGRSAQGRFARRGERYPARHHRNGRQQRVLRRRSEPRQGATLETARVGSRRHRPHRRAAQRLGLARRLAAVLPQSRSDGKGHAPGRAARWPRNFCGATIARWACSFRPTSRRKSRFPKRRCWPRCSTATRAVRKSPRAKPSTSRRPTSMPAPSGCDCPKGSRSRCCRKRLGAKRSTCGSCFVTARPIVSKALMRPPRCCRR